ncbi:MAG: hypothetical protein Kow0059_02500 [Candidatus Sumerlaeia bacterium]
MTASPRKILMAAHTAEPTGAPRVLAELACACRAAGHDVTVVMPGASPFDQTFRDVGIAVHRIDHPQSSVPFSDVVRTPAALFRRLAYYRQWRRWLQGRSFDLAYLSASVEVLRGAACRRAGLPICWHIHEEWPARPPFLARRKIVRIKNLSHLLVFCASACRRAFEPLPPGLGAEVLWNGINLDPYRKPLPPETRAETRRELGASDQDWLVCTTAFIQPRKGIDVGLEALRLLGNNKWRELQGRPIRWVVIGERHDAWAGYCADLERRVRDFGLSDRFSITGFRRDLPRVLGAADLFLMPSRSEAMPLALCEAMAAGLAAVCSDVGDIRAMMKGEQCGWLVPPDDPRALASALAAALGDDAERARRGAAAQQRAFADFSLQAMNEQFLALLDRYFFSRSA